MADVTSGGFARDSATGAITVIGPSGGDVAGGRVLASVDKTDANYTTTSGFADVTGLTAVTFTVPSSGKVWVHGYVNVAFNTTAAQGCAMKVVDTAGSVDIVVSATGYSAVANAQFVLFADRYVTGLTPGASKTYKMQAGVSVFTGTATLSIAATTPAGIIIRAG